MIKLKVYFSAILIIGFAGINQNKAQQSRSVKVSVRTQDGKEVASYEESYALVVGISDYTNGWPNLPNAVKDAEKIRDALIKQNFHVIMVKNPSKKNLGEAINQFMFRYGSNPQNRLVFYFAGHGHSIKMSWGGQMGYIVPADAPLPYNNLSGFMENAVSMQDFDTQARQIQAKHVLYFFDSCFSGSIFASSRGTVPADISDKINEPVRQYIVAGEADEEVPDQSVFTEYLIAALEGEGDLTKDGYITGTELGLFLQDKVEKYTNSTQHPQYGKIRDSHLDKGDFVFMMNGKDGIAQTERKGTIYVRTEPWCEIDMDGKTYTSPFFIRDVTFGTHKLLLKRIGYRKIIKDVYLSEQETVIKVFEKLEKE